MSRTLLHAVVTGGALLTLSLLFGVFIQKDNADDLGQQVPREGKQDPAFLSKLTADLETVRTRKGKYERVKDAEKEVIEYVTPKGEPGYQVVWEDAEGKHSIGYGPEAADRTFFIPTPVIVASST